MGSRDWLKNKALWAFGGSAATLATAIGFSLASCATAPTPVPVRTFERASKIDVVCMQVVVAYDPTGNPFPGQPNLPHPVPQQNCTPVAAGIDGSLLPFHLFALVTQETRGEVAVIDLTAGVEIDVDLADPGYNFLPVGKNPTDIASTPDGEMTFVAAAEVNKPAIYALPSTMILGDAPSGAATLGARPAITNWPSCALPQAPGSIAVVPKTVVGGATSGTITDAGAGEGGTEAGTTDAGTSDAGPTVTPTGVHGTDYQLVVVLPGDARTSAKLVTIDPEPFFRGAGIDTTTGTAVAPGSLGACPITSAVELAGSADLPKSVQSGPAWDDGIKWVDGGAPAEALPAKSLACLGGGADAGTGLPIDAPADLLPRGGASALAGQVLYVADAQLPMIHVFDLRSGAVQELPPLVATSIADPARRVTISQIAVSPTTRDFKRYLYAIDEKVGSLIIYDVTDPVKSSRLPLTRPHPETNQISPPDRIQFSSPVATVAFARHEWSVTLNANITNAATTGALCNPNANAINAAANGGAVDPGIFYTVNSAVQVGPPNANNLVGPSPIRLRGIFAFATLASGQMIAIDVDDWDAPCRRPDPISGPPTFGSVSAITPAQPDLKDTDPYHAPSAFPGAVTLESFYPVSAPNRPRSGNFLRNDPTLGNNMPNINGIPQLLVDNATVVVVGKGSESNPVMIPAVSSDLEDPTQYQLPSDPVVTRTRVPLEPPSVRFSFESADVHVNQDWTVTYEGPLPGFKGIAGTVQTTDDFSSLDLTQPQALFCRRGVEDYRIGQQKAALVAAELTKTNLVTPDRLTKKTSDYVQIIDDILPYTDPYWAEDTQSCWSLGDSDADKRLTSAGNPGGYAQARYDACAATFGDGQDVNPDMPVSRDFPVIEAYEDRLVLGRFATPATSAAPSTDTREVVVRDPSNARVLKLAACCFHNQFQFNVRSASEWVAVGTNSLYMHHVVEGAGGACVLSCRETDALLNGRAPTVPRVSSVDGSLVDPATIYAPPNTTPPPGSSNGLMPLNGMNPFSSINRNSILAMRNPMFSFFIANGSAPATSGTGFTDVYPKRDSVWKFSTRGQYSPLFINLATNTTAVSPQSTRFIEALGQLAVVDGSAQGLMLINLDTVALDHAPYF